MSAGKVDVLAVMERSRSVVREASDSIDVWEAARDHLDTFVNDSPERDAAVKAYNAAAARKQAALDAGFRNSKRAEEALAAVAELIAAASAGTDEPQDRAVSPGLWFGPNRAERLRNVLSRIGAP